MKNSRVSKAVQLALAFSTASAFALTNVAMAAEEAEVEEKVERIQVTGSRIKRTEIEGPAPVVTISAADLVDKGFTTAYEAIQSLSSATGSNQGQAFGGFTANAETVNFRGLGPNRTLVLLNGKRVANYPRAYNGQNNVFNLATIPFAAIERIDIVTGGNSAIYGSDAIAGVMNIITKRGVEESTLNLDGAMSAQGDGHYRHGSFVTGGEQDKFSWTLALDHMNQDPLFLNQRSWGDDRFDDPSDIGDFPEYALVMPRTLMGMQYDFGAGGWRYQTPPDGTCQQFENLHDANRPSRGDYCGRDATGNYSIVNERKNSSVYLTGTYEINDNHQVTGEILYWTSESASFGSQFWDTRFFT
jgi:outer membrane receptor for ferrienterochelin and colicin